MFTISANNETLHDPRMFDDGYVVMDPTLAEEVNTAGTFTFSVPSSNPRYDQLTNRSTYVKIENEKGLVWRGRVMSSQKDWQKNRAVTCEGDLAFLNDSIQRPYNFTGTPAQLFSAAISAHNQQVDVERQFTVGTVTVTDPNNYIVRSSDSAMTTWEFMQTALFGSSLGGYIRTRTVGSVHYIDYLASFDHNNTQSVEFGRNLLDITELVSAEDVVTCLIPYGAQLPEEQQQDPPASGSWNGNRVTIESVTTGNVDYIKNQTGINLFGEVWGTATWDEVTIPANLLTKATAYLADQIANRITVSCSALDLSLIDYDIESIKLGDSVEIYSIPHDIDIWLMCRSKTTPLMAPGDSSVVFGAETKSLTDLQKTR